MNRAMAMALTSVVPRPRWRGFTEVWYDVSEITAGLNSIGTYYATYAQNLGAWANRLATYELIVEMRAMLVEASSSGAVSRELFGAPSPVSGVFTEWRPMVAGSNPVVRVVSDYSDTYTRVLLELRDIRNGNVQSGELDLSTYAY